MKTIAELEAEVLRCADDARTAATVHLTAQAAHDAQYQRVRGAMMLLAQLQSAFLVPDITTAALVAVADEFVAQMHERMRELAEERDAFDALRRARDAALEAASDARWSRESKAAQKRRPR